MSQGSPEIFDALQDFQLLGIGETWLKDHQLSSYQLALSQIISDAQLDDN
jgi:hypothetical protein